MSYFRELPNLEYESPFATRISSSSYVQAKNIFRRMKIRDDLQNIFTIFNKYEIREGARPDTVAEEIYGKSDLDWVVLLSANIINVRDQWPLSSKDLYDYTVNKYGLENINKIHHYETKEIKDSGGNIIIPKNKQVDKNFSLFYSTVDRTYGQILDLNIKNGENEFIPGTYTNIGATSNGVGIGASFDVTVNDNGEIATVNVTDKGKDYDLNDNIEFIEAKTIITLADDAIHSFTSGIGVTQAISAGIATGVIKFTTTDSNVVTLINVVTGDFDTSSQLYIDGVGIGKTPNNIESIAGIVKNLDDSTVVGGAVEVPSNNKISIKERLSNTIAISNYEYETRENQKKETIYLLKPSYLQQFLNDMRTEMAYSDSSQFVNKSLIRTQNTRVS
jgi:hypothetical protein